MVAISRARLRARLAGSADDVARELEQLRDRFRKTTNALASAAHDLKTPLAILNGYIDLLQSQKLGPLNDRQREVMADMFSSGQRLQQFIQDFLTFSVLEIGELRMQYIEGDMNACLSEVCRLWSGRFQERGLALYFLANDKLTPFPFDGPKIQRVISNLLENASKYTPQGGTVWLHAEPHMWERRGVSKSGCQRRPPPAIDATCRTPSKSALPIPARESGRSFTWKSSMISSACRAANRPRAWASGLAISRRRLLQGMGGKIWVESEPGAGCKFSFLIPLKPIVNSPQRGTK